MKFKGTEEQRDLFSINYLISQKAKMSRISTELQRHYAISKGDTDLFKTLKSSFSESSTDDISVVALVGNLQGVESFNHPIYHGRVEYIDARPYVNKVGDIRDQENYDIMVRRAMLDKLWMENPEAFFSKDLLNLMAKTFVEWISRTLSINLALNINTTNKFNSVLLAYIIAQSKDFSNESLSDIEACMIKKCSELLRWPHQVSLSTLEMYPSVFENIFKNPGRIHYLVGGLSKMYGEQDYITERSLYTMIMPGATMLPNSGQLACIAIENIPTFVAMLYSVSQPSFKSTKLGLPMYNNRQQFGQTLDTFMKLNTNYSTVDAR